MDFLKMFEFLEQLQQHNHKEWMDAHRKEYHAIRNSFINWLDDMNTSLAKIDPNYFDTPGKKAINRINNNLMFFPNKPVYKDHFGAGLDQVSKQGDFYIEIGINSCFAGGGYWHPSPKLLKSIREAIDYNGEELVTIMNTKGFQKWFGGFIAAESLSRPPKGYKEDHPHIHLLKMKSFAAGYHLSRSEVLAPNFEETIVEIYKALLPFRSYLNEAVTV